MHFISPVLWQFLVKWLTDFALFPAEASSIAPYADALYFFLILISLVGMVIVIILVAGFSIRYRAEKNPVATHIEGSTLLEAFTLDDHSAGAVYGLLCLGRAAVLPHLQPTH